MSDPFADATGQAAFIPKPKKQRKKPKAQINGELAPVEPPSRPNTSMGTVFDMPELFRHFLTYLDGKSLACMARVQKGWTCDVAAVMYREIPGKQLFKMSRGEPRRAIYCDAVRSVTLRHPWCTDGMRKELKDDPNFSQHSEVSDRWYHPALVHIAIKTVLRKLPNVRRISSDGRSKYSAGSIWSATFDHTGSRGHVNVQHEVRHRGGRPTSDEPLTGFTNRTTLLLADGLTEAYDYEGMSAFLQASPHDVAEFRDAHCWLETVGTFFDTLVSSGKDLMAITALSLYMYPALNIDTYRTLAQRLAPAKELRELLMCKPALSVNSKAVSLTSLPGIMTPLSANHKRLQSFSIDCSWSYDAEDKASGWCRSPEQSSIKSLRLRFSQTPDTTLLNVAAFLSCYMAPGGELEIEWRRYTGVKRVRHPFEGVIPEGVQQTTPNNVLAVYTSVIAAFHRLAKRSPTGKLPEGSNFSQLGIKCPKNIDHIEYDAAGSLMPVFESLVPRLVTACEFFFPTEGVPESLFDFIRDCSANADDALKIYDLLTQLDKTIPADIIAGIDGLADLLGYVGNASAKLRRRLQRLADEKEAAIKAAQLEQEKAKREKEEEKNARSRERAAKLKAKAKSKVKALNTKKALDELETSCSEYEEKPRRSTKAGSKGKAKAAPKVKKQPGTAGMVKVEASKSRTKVKAKAKSDGMGQASSSRVITDTDDEEEVDSGLYYVKDGWLVLNDDTDDEAEYIPSPDK